MNPEVAPARAKGEKLEKEQIMVFLQQKIDSAQNVSTGGISKARQSALKAYFGEPYGNERKGRSKVVSRDVLETVQWTLPRILRTFTQNKKVVVFEPEGREDEAAAELETTVANHYITKEGGAFMALYSFLFDALMNPNSYLKVTYEQKERVSHQEFTGLTAQGLAQLLEEEGVEPIEASERVETIEQQTGNPQQPTVRQQIEVFDVKIKRTRDRRRVKVEPCPPEEVLVDNALTGLDLDDADFVCHRTQMTISDLRKMDIPEEELDQIPWPEYSGTGEVNWATERVVRYFYEDEGPNVEHVDDPSMRKLWVHECYVWMDVDGDGIAEHWRVLMGGYHILEMEQVDYQPFVATCSMPVTHKHAGLSLVQIVEDLQKIKTTLFRQLLDNLYRINRNRKYVNHSWFLPDGSTKRQLANPLSEQVAGRGAPGQNILEERTTNALGDVLPALQHFDEVLKIRSGNDPSMHFDTGVLQQATASALQQAQEKASDRLDMMVRIIAETGIKPAMVKVHQLLRAHQNKPLELQLKKEWVEVDPRTWRDRVDVAVNVGLGHSNKGANVALLMQLFETQLKLLPMGLVEPKHIYATAARIIEAGDLGEPTEFFVDPSTPGWQPPQGQPDPMVQAQAQTLQAQAQKLTQEAEAAMFKARSQAQEAQTKLGIEQAKTQGDLSVKLQELELKRLEAVAAEAETLMRYGLSQEEASAKIREILASAELKAAQTEAIQNPPEPPEEDQHAPS